MIKRYICNIFIATIYVFTFLVPTCYAQDYYTGVDVSSFQGSIDFEQLVEAGCEAIYIRAGEGDDFVDDKYKENYTGADKVGLEYGFYYYVTATTTQQAQTQATAFANLISGTGYTLRPAMDFEEFGSLSIDESNEIALAFLTKLEELTGVTPAIYSDASNVESRWSSELSSYPLWVAAYEDLSDPKEYTLPDNDVWTSWSGYQYTDSLRISGINDDVDGDIYTSALLISDNKETESSENTETSDQSEITYTIKYGDTLYKISRLYQTTIANIVELNDIINPDLIYADTTLQINKVENYHIRVGDTLSEIACLFNANVLTIAQLNNIDDIDLIYAGDTLQLP